MIFPPWSPLAPGAIDSVVLDFTEEQQGLTTTPSVQWSCELSPSTDPTAVVDPAPASRIISQSILTNLPIRNPITNAVTFRPGCFAYAVVGTFPPTAEGGTYVLSAQVTFSDNRAPIKWSTILCREVGT